MRLIICVLFSGLSLLALTSCSNVPSETPRDSAGSSHSASVSAQSEMGEAAAAGPHATHLERGEHSSHTAAAGSAPGQKAVMGHESTQYESIGHKQHVTAGHSTAPHGQSSTHGHRGRHGGHLAASNAEPKIVIGEKVPDFEVTLNGKVWKLSELQKNAEITPDGTLVLTFWCSFCHSCRSVEMSLDKLAQESKGKAGVIALDASFGETQEEISAFKKKNGLTLPIALSADGSAADVFGVNSTTTTVIIDSKGTLRYFGQFGDRSHSYAKEALNAVLAGKDVPVKRTRPKG